MRRTLERRVFSNVCLAVGWKKICNREAWRKYLADPETRAIQRARTNALAARRRAKGRAGNGAMVARAQWPFYAGRLLCRSGMPCIADGGDHGAGGGNGGMGAAPVPSKWWYVGHLFFGVITGLVVYILYNDTNQEAARKQQRRQAWGHNAGQGDLAAPVGISGKAAVAPTPRS